MNRVWLAERSKERARRLHHTALTIVAWSCRTKKLSMTSHFACSAATLLKNATDLKYLGAEFWG